MIIKTLKLLIAPFFISTLHSQAITSIPDDGLSDTPHSSIPFFDPTEKSEVLTLIADEYTKKKCPLLTEKEAEGLLLVHHLCWSCIEDKDSTHLIFTEPNTKTLFTITGKSRGYLIQLMGDALKSAKEKSPYIFATIAKKARVKRRIFD